MKQLFSIVLLLIFLFGCQNQNSIPSSNKKQSPNILLIFCDDLGYGDLALYGNQDVSTPNLDQLGRESVRLDPFYAQPVCAPSRAQLMTGRHFLKTGVWGVHGGRDYLNLEEKTMAQVLQKADYSTAFIGKWHLGKQGPYLPQYRGFDRVWRQTDLYSYYEPTIDNGSEIAKVKGWTTDYFTDRAIEVVEKKDENPFFLYLAYTAVHEPYHAVDSLVNKYLDKGFSKSLSTLYAMTEQLDNNIGRLLEALEESGEADNTVVIFTSDNGPIGNPVNMAHLTEEEMQRRNPKGFRGLKGNVLENGNRVAAFFRYGERWQPKVVETSGGDLMDIFPTVLEVVGVDSLEDVKQLEGQSLVSLLEGKTNALASRNLYFGNHETFWSGKKRLYDFMPNRADLQFARTSLSVKRDSFKMVQCWGAYEGNTSYTALFNLAQDPQEQEDVSKQFPRMRQNLQSDLEQWWTTEVLEGSDSYQIPTFYIGYDGEKQTKVHACAPIEVRGNVEGNATSVKKLEEGAVLKYQVEVVESGKHEVALDVRTKLQKGKVGLRLQGEELEGDLVTLEGNRLNLGVMELEEGKGILELEVLELEEGEVLEELVYTVFER